jgi:hypothetical protein
MSTSHSGKVRSIKAIRALRRMVQFRRDGRDSHSEAAKMTITGKKHFDHRLLCPPARCLGLGVAAGHAAQIGNSHCQLTPVAISHLNSRCRAVRALQDGSSPHGKTVSLTRPAGSTSSISPTGAGYTAFDREFGVLPEPWAPSISTLSAVRFDTALLAEHSDFSSNKGIHQTRLCDS